MKKNNKTKKAAALGTDEFRVLQLFYASTSDNVYYGKEI